MRAILLPFFPSSFFFLKGKSNKNAIRQAKNRKRKAILSGAVDISILKIKLISETSKSG